MFLLLKRYALIIPLILPKSSDYIYSLKRETFLSESFFFFFFVVFFHSFVRLEEEKKVVACGGFVRRVEKSER